VPERDDTERFLWPSDDCGMPAREFDDRFQDWKRRAKDLDWRISRKIRKHPVGKLSTAARKHWLTVEWLPKYAPELNDIEVVWHDLKAHHLAHQTFTDAETLDAAIHQAIATLNVERARDPLGNQRISA
jgi:transposase